jgi:hypothetical protein
MRGKDSQLGRSLLAEAESELIEPGMSVFAPASGCLTGLLGCWRELAKAWIARYAGSFLGARWRVGGQSRSFVPS